MIEKGAKDDEEIHIAGAYICTHAGHSDGLKTAIEKIGEEDLKMKFFEEYYKTFRIGE